MVMWKKEQKHADKKIQKRIERTKHIKRIFSFAKLKPYEKREHEKYIFNLLFLLIICICVCVLYVRGRTREFELKNRFYGVR